MLASWVTLPLGNYVSADTAVPGRRGDSKSPGSQIALHQPGLLKRPNRSKFSCRCACPV
jgi:hypothetical protein